MYENYTDRVRKMMQYANDEAHRLRHEYIGTEHILLGLIAEGTGVAANVLKNLDIEPRKVRREVEKIVMGGPDMPSMGQRPQTPRAKKVLEWAIEEARALNCNYVGTEHLLLGLLREEEGVAAQVLMNLGLKLSEVREEVRNLLGVPRESIGADSALRSLADAELEAAELIPPKIRYFPDGLRAIVASMEDKIDALIEEKEQAVAVQDFEKAAHLRDLADKMKKLLVEVIRIWPK
jgi:ATP-dependent Clp protease ATP-binding subunit ClpC